MGSHIDSFFPRSVERSLEESRTFLDKTFAQIKADRVVVRNCGMLKTQPPICEEQWSLWNEGQRIAGEGPDGFAIYIYEGVVQLSSAERFGALCKYGGWGIEAPLRHVFEFVASSLGPGEFAIASGGYGDTDIAGDLAHTGASFARVCQCLETELGPPATSWQELEAGELRWLLRRMA